MSIYWFCTKLCGISALPSKTDFKAHTARFEFEGRSVWKVVESEKVLVLFCFCSSDANDVQMTTEMATGISSCDEPKRVIVWDVICSVIFWGRMTSVDKGRIARFWNANC